MSLRSSGLMAVVLTAMVSQALLASDRFVVFGEGPNWLSMNPRTHTFRKIDIPAVLDVSSLAISRNSSELAIIGTDREHRRTGLWFVGHDGHPRCLSSEPGIYSDPVFSADGKWVYFAHGTMTGQHYIFGQYAQLFRVSTSTGTLEQLTNEAGCHLSPGFADNGQLFFIHSSCAGRAWLERTLPGTTPSAKLFETMGSLSEAYSAPSGRSILYVGVDPDTFSINEWRQQSHSSHVLLHIPRKISRVRPQYGRDSTEILYQNDGYVWSWQHGNAEQIANLDEEHAQ